MPGEVPGEVTGEVTECLGRTSDVGDVRVRETAAEGGHGALAVGHLLDDRSLVEAAVEELRKRLHAHAKSHHTPPFAISHHHHHFGGDHGRGNGRIATRACRIHWARRGHRLCDAFMD